MCIFMAPLLSPQTRLWHQHLLAQDLQNWHIETTASRLPAEPQARFLRDIPGNSPVIR